jgi:hypothetical protein
MCPQDFNFTFRQFPQSSGRSAGRPDEFMKKIDQNVAKPILSKLMIKFYHGKSTPKI